MRIKPVKKEPVLEAGGLDTSSSHGCVVMKFSCPLHVAKKVLSLLESEGIAGRSIPKGIGLDIPDEVMRLQTFRDVMEVLFDRGFDEDEMVDVCSCLKAHGHQAMARVASVQERVSRTIERLNMERGDE